MLNRRKKAPGIGLHIGTTHAALSCIKHKSGKIQVQSYGMIPIPSGSAYAGVVNDPQTFGQDLAKLVSSLNLQGNQVVSAVSGPQVYMRNIILPTMKSSELREAAFFEATAFLPIPVDEAAIDISPLHDYRDEEGKKTEVFFVAIRRQIIANLQTACDGAGLHLVAVELEPLALYRILGDQSELKAQAFLYLGASRSYLFVIKYGAVLFQRSISFGTTSIALASNTDHEPNQEVYQDNFEGEGDNQYLMSKLITETARCLEHFLIQYKGEPLGPIIICGSGARIRGLDVMLSQTLEQHFVRGDALARLIPPADSSQCDSELLAYGYLISLGLAAREVI